MILSKRHEYLINLVSVIIPCFNVELYIEECLESVYSQTYKNIEVICVDNKSTDGTLGLIQKLKREKYNNLIILNETESGAAAARNKGLTIAKGDWIQFLDADDLLLQQKLTNQIDLVESNDISFIAAAYYKRDIKGNEITNFVNSNVWDGLVSTKLGITSANLFSKQYLVKVGGWKSELTSSQEYDLMFRLLKINDKSVLIFNNPETVIREREVGQISQGNSLARVVNYLKLRKEINTYSLNSKIEIDNLLLKRNMLISIRELYKYDKKMAEQEFFDLDTSLTIKVKKEVYGQLYLFLYKFFTFTTIEGVLNKLKIR